MDILVQILNQYASELLALYKGKLQDAKASGLLIDTATFIVRHNNNAYEVIFELQDYYKWVEYGRKPNSKFPPINSIREWIKIKPILPQPYILPSGRQVIPTESQLTYLIARKIAIDGIKAKPYLQESIAELNERFLSLIAKALSENVLNQLLIDFKF